MAEYEHPEVDLSPLLVPGIKFAVRCETQKEAIQFITAVREQFPDKETYVLPNNTKWNEDNYGNHGGRAYFPDLNNEEGEPLMHGDVEFANSYGFTLVYFEDLLVKTQIEESDMPLDVLFGSLGGV